MYEARNPRRDTREAAWRITRRRDSLLARRRFQDEVIARIRRAASTEGKHLKPARLVSRGSRIALLK